MADLKKTVAIEFETNAAKAAKDTKALAGAQDSVAKSTKKAWSALDTHNARMRNAASSAKQVAAAQDKYNQKLRDFDAAVARSKAHYAGLNAGVQTSASRMRDAAASAGIYAAAIIGAAKAADELSQRALQLTEVQRNLPFSIDKAKRASQGLVDQFTLQQKAVQANTLGAAKNAEEFEKLVKVATSLARAHGQDATKGVEDFTMAIARGSPPILDNLGLTLKHAEAQQIYADHLGIAKSALDDTQKSEAFRFAALKKGEEVIKNLQFQEDGLALSIQKTKIELQDGADAALRMADAFSKQIEPTGTFAKAVDMLVFQLDDLAEVSSKLESSFVFSGRFQKSAFAMEGLASRARTSAMSPLNERRARIDTENAVAANNASLAITAANFEDFGGQNVEYDIFGNPIRRRGRGGRGDNSIAMMSDSEARGIQSEIEGSISGGQDFSEEEENARARFDWEREHQQKLNEMHAEAERERAEQMKAAAKERQRIVEDEMRKREAAMRAGFAAFQSVGNETIALSRAVVSATGESSEEQAKKMNKVTGIITTVQGVAAIAQGAIEVAAQNYGKGIPMIIAGTAATVTGAAMIANPLNPPGAPGGAGGGTASEFGPGTPPSGATSTPSSDRPSGPISRPDTAPPQQGGQNTSPSRGEARNVVVIENFNTLGTTNEEVANNIQQMLDDRDRMVGNA
jgi:hypothetical protein